MEGNTREPFSFFPLQAPSINTNHSYRRRSKTKLWHYSRRPLMRPHRMYPLCHPQYESITTSTVRLHSAGKELILFLWHQFSNSPKQPWSEREGTRTSAEQKKGPPRSRVLLDKGGVILKRDPFMPTPCQSISESITGIAT